MDDRKKFELDTEETTSLEYEDDFALVPPSETPSFDVEDGVGDIVDIVDELSLDDFSEPSSFTDLPETVTVETEFYDEKKGNTKSKQVRVKFQDVSKPYVPKVTSLKNYTNFLHLVNEGDKTLTDTSPDSGINELSGLTLEEQEKQRQEWAAELEQLEDQISTLRTVLAAKLEDAQKLKQKLGISVWKGIQDDMNQGLRNVKNSNVYHRLEESVEQFCKAVVDAPLYQKTESVIKATTEKTSSILGGLGSGISYKLGQLKNSESFRSLEEKVGSAYENVKTKVAISPRSTSLHGLDEAYRNSEKVTSPVSTPTIAEEHTT
ncbi:tumor protein D54 isoform X1 [Cimex lectularius]|uniref:Tumor protein D54 n=1 Tax=Cimex lectularius TaxID=79782 RepID=A0A8I6SR60_CIMLE|nr:tumor protein D54 isoform X1 [Cimex lectularius]